VKQKFRKRKNWMIRIRSLIFAPIVVLSVLAGGLLFTSVPAAQASSPTAIGSFGPGGLTTPPVFVKPESIAVEQSTGDVYVYDGGKNEATGEIGSVYKFNANGEPENFTHTGSNAIEGFDPEAFNGGESQIAVDNSSGPAKGDIYIVTGGKVLIYNSEGKELAPLTEANEPAGVAVDSSGAVYVSFRELKSVDKYTPTANPVTTADFACSVVPSNEPEVKNVAVNSAGDIYLVEGEHGRVVTFTESQCGEPSAAGTLVFGGSGVRPSTLAVDPKSDDVYINDGSKIVVLNSSDTQVEEFSSLSESYGVAVNDASGHEGDVYAPASENESVVSIFGSASPPTEFPLKVKKVGLGTGTVTSSPSGIDCGITCEFSFPEGGLVTLTAAADPGSEFVKWTGCERETILHECEVTMTGAKTVEVELNLKGGGGGGGATGPTGPTGPAGPTGSTGSTGATGATGSNGVGVTISVIAPGEHGCVDGGTAVVSSVATTYVCNGTNGSNGGNGSNGSNGSAGGQGPVGPVGPAGAPGPAGPAGQVQLVTCKTVSKGKKKVQQCTTKLVSGTVKFTASGASAQATLSRHGAVFAAGMARVARGRISLRLTPLRRLRPGHYTLTLIAGAGRRETIRREAFTLR
jgi:Divergent InlB B-repeat domain